MWTTSLSKESQSTVSEFQLDLLDVLILAFLCGVGIFLLLCYPKRKTWLPVLRKRRDSNQWRGRSKRRRKGGTLKGWRVNQSEEEEARKVLSLLQRPLGDNHVTHRFRQLLCPEPSCEVCNRATAEVNQLLFPDVLEDTPAAFPLASTTPVTEPSLTLSSAFSTVPPGDPMPVPLTESSTTSIRSPTPVPLVDKFLRPTSPGYPQPPKPVCPLDSKFTVNHSLPEPIAFPLFPPHDTQRLDPVVQPAAPLSQNTIFSFPTLSQDLSSLPNSSHTLKQTNSFACQQVQPNVSQDGTLTMTQSQLTSISLKPALENSLDSPKELSTCDPTNRDTDLSSLSVSEFSWWQAQSKNPILSNISHSDCEQEHVSLHQPETCLCRDPANKHLHSSSLYFLGLNIQAHLETRMKKKMMLQTLQKKETEKGPLSKQMWSKHLQISSGNSQQSLDRLITSAPKTDWQTESNSDQFCICQNILYVKTLRENLEQKYSQLYWGLPSLHSESLVAPLLVPSSSFTLDHPFILFNRIYDPSVVQNQDQEPIPFSHSYPLHIANVNSQSQIQTKPHFQFQLPHLPQPPCHIHSRLPIPVSSSLHQIGDCGVPLHRCQDESDSQTSMDSQDLEWHISQKQQENLWGVDPRFQQSQEAICLQVPSNIPVVKLSSQTYVPEAIHSGHFLIASDAQEEVESHLPTRSILHWYHQPCRNAESFVLVEPHCELRDWSQKNNRYSNSQLTDLQGQGDKDLTEIEWHLSGSFHEREPTKFQLEQAMRSDHGHILSLEDSLQGFSGCHAVTQLGTVSKTDSNCRVQAVSHPGDEELSVSRDEKGHRPIKTILRLHLTRKFWQIIADRIPLDVCDSWLVNGNTLSDSEGSQTSIENIDLRDKNVGKGYCENRESYFINYNTQQVLESHIIRYRTSQVWGLPLKVLQSVKVYILREAKTWPLPQIKLPISASLDSGINSKGSSFKLLKGHATTFKENNIRTSSVPTLNCSLSDASLNGKERQEEAQKTPVSDDLHGTAEDVQRKQNSNESPLVTTHSIVNTENLSETRAEQEPKNETLNSDKRSEIVQDKEMVEKNSHRFCMINIFQSQELCSLQSPPDNFLTARASGGTHKLKIHTNKVETSLLANYSQEEIKISKDAQLLNLETQISRSSESEKHIQADGQPTDMPIPSNDMPVTSTDMPITSTDMPMTSNNLTCKSTLIPTLNTSGGAMEISQVLHGPLEDSDISMKHKYEGWVSKQALPKYQDRNFSLAIRRGGIKARKYGHEDLSLGTSRRESQSVEVHNSEATSPSLLQDEQFPETYLRKKVKKFSQWIESKRKNMGQERPLLATKLISTFVQHLDPLRSAAPSPKKKPPEAPELMTVIGRVLEEKLAHIHELEVLELSQQEEISTQVNANKGQLCVSDTQQEVWGRTKSESPETVSADQSIVTDVREGPDRVCSHQKSMSFHSQLLHRLSSPFSRESVPHANSSSVDQECPVTQVTPMPDDNTVFRDLTLLFKQKELLTHFQEGKTSP